MEGNKINSPPFPIPDVARQPHNDDDDYGGDGDGEEEKEEVVELIFLSDPCIHTRGLIYGSWCLQQWFLDLFDVTLADEDTNSIQSGDAI